MDPDILHFLPLSFRYAGKVERQLSAKVRDVETVIHVSFRFASVMQVK